MADGALGYLIFYVAIFATVAILGYYGSDDVGVAGEFPEPPSLSADYLTLIDSLYFVFDIVVFFFFLQGLSFFGMPVIFSTLIALILNTGLLYILARLVRGGG
jgi:hypothetical protein